jgi:metal-responsive CopG/Arc/MetJ family transcriptional regulator
MPKSTTPKNLGGRPRTINGDRYIGIRLPRALVDAVDHWADHEDIRRSEAVRRLLEQALGAKGKR